MLYSFPIQCSQSLNRRIGAGKALKIGDKLPAAFLCDDPLRCLDGFIDIVADRNRKISASTGTENTAACIQLTIPGRTREASVQSKLIDLFSVILPKTGIQAPIMVDVLSSL